MKREFEQTYRIGRNGVLDLSLKTSWDRLISDIDIEVQRTRFNGSLDFSTINDIRPYSIIHDLSKNKFYLTNFHYLTETYVDEISDFLSSLDALNYLPPYTSFKSIEKKKMYYFTGQVDFYECVNYIPFYKVKTDNNIQLANSLSLINFNKENYIYCSIFRNDFHQFFKSSPETRQISDDSYVLVDIEKRDDGIMLTDRTNMLSDYNVMYLTYNSIFIDENLRYCFPIKKRDISPEGKLLIHKYISKYVLED